MRKLIIGVGLLAAVTAGSACTTLPIRQALAPRPMACPPGEYVILHGQAVDCDLRPEAGNTLTEVWDASTEGSDWGSDATLAHADQECLDSGGTPIWSAGVELRCTLMDF
jgi:hypothetical protein